MITNQKNTGGIEPSPWAIAASETAAVNEPASANEAARPRPRGFAAMDSERVKEIARKGGLAAHAAGTAHEFSSDEARAAGRKGGTAPHVRRGGTRRPARSAEVSPDQKQNGDRDTSS